MNSKKIILSSAGVIPPPDVGNPILIRPEKPAPLTDAISIWVSLSTKLQEVSSITRVNDPASSSLFTIVSGIGVGVGV